MKRRVVTGFLVSLLSVAPVLAAAEAVVKLNNEGVTLLKASNFAAAIEKFRLAIRMDSGYKLGKENLAIAYNNYALSLPAEQALKYFRQSYYLDSNNSTTMANLTEIIKTLGKNPKSFTDLVELGDKAEKEKDHVGAIIQYQMALALKDDSALRQKLLQVPEPSETLGVLSGKSAGKSEPKTETKSDSSETKSEKNEPYKPGAIKKGPNYESFMADVQNKIKSTWTPPAEMTDAQKVTTKFNVAKDGTVSAAEITTDKTNVAAIDDGCLRVLRGLGKVSPPPSGAPDPVVVHFDFKKKIEGTSDNVSVEGIDFGSYMAELQRRIKFNWHPPRGKESLRVVTQFVVSRSGHVDKIKVTKSTGSLDADEAGIEAVRKADNCYELPSGAPKVVDIEFTFDYNIINKDGSRVPFKEKPNLDQSEPPKNASSKSSPSSSNSIVIPKAKDSALADQLLQEGETALDGKDYQTAVNVFETALKMAPDQKSRFAAKLALAADGLGMSVKSDSLMSLKYFHRAVVLDPDNKTAKDHLNEAIKNQGKDPDSFESRVELAEDARKAGDLDAAEYEYNQALNIREDLSCRSRLNEIPALKTFTEQIKKAEAAIAKSPSSLSAHLDLAQALLSLGRLEAARDEFNKVLSLDGSNAVAKQKLSAIEKSLASQKSSGDKP